MGKEKEDRYAAGTLGLNFKEGKLEENWVNILYWEENQVKRENLSWEENQVKRGISDNLSVGEGSMQCTAIVRKLNCMQ